jgi:hypothetical protein
MSRLQYLPKDDSSKVSAAYLIGGFIAFIIGLFIEAGITYAIANWVGQVDLSFREAFAIGLYVNLLTLGLRSQIRKDAA